MSEQTEPAARPAYIVVFRRTGEPPVQAMTSILSLHPAPAEPPLPRVMRMEKPGTETSVTYYQDLGVAAIDAGAEDVARLRSLDEVEDVLVNEKRTIPTPVELTRADRSDRGAGAAFAPPRVAAQFEDTATMTWGLQAIGLTTASTLTGRGVRVAVLDTGIDLGHPDFTGRVPGANTRSFVAGEAVQDEHGHGTHCCGTVAGPLTSGGRRRYGVAPNVELLVGKVLSNQGSGFDDQIIAGIEWAATMGARIISMSLGSAREVGGAFSALYERVAERLSQEGPGVLLIAAAGNDSRRPSFTRPVGNPAACPSIMGIAAVDADLRIAPFSNRQMDGIGRLDISGPGVEVYSSIPGGFDSFSGTSMATPHIAGVAALHLEATPQAPSGEIWDRLLRSAQPLGNAADFGAGLVRVPQARAAAGV
jgi:subtilisin family serine protease